MPRYPYRQIGVLLNRDFRNNQNQNLVDIAGDIAEQKARVDTQISSVGQPSEVVDARVDTSGAAHTVLKDRLDSDYNRTENSIAVTDEISLNIKKVGGLGTYNPSTGSGPDETMTIQNALNSLSSGDELVFTRGNYKISADITVPDGISIKWTKMAHVYVTGGTKGFILGNDCELITPHIHETRPYADVPNQTAGVTGDTKQNIKIKDGLIEGFTFANISMKALTNLTITGTETRNAGTRDDGNSGWEGLGVYLTGQCENVTLSKNYTHDNGKHGIQAWANSGELAVKSITVTDCNCLDNGDTGIQFTEVQDYIIKGNHCNGNGQNGGPYGGQGIQSVSNTSLTQTGEISNNTTLANTENGIEVVSSSDVNVTSNISKNNSWNGVKVWNNSKNVNLTSNICGQNGSNGIEVDNGFMTKSNGNTTKQNGSHGELYSNSSYSIVSDPISADNGQTAANRSGIEVEGGDHAFLFSGVAFDDQSTPTQEYGSRFYGVTGGAVYHFHANGNKTQALLTDGNSTGIVTNNPSMQDIYFGGTTDANGVRELSGSGSPEGIVTAPIGSKYHRIDGSTDQTEYVKESGNGNLGWKSIISLTSGPTSNRPGGAPIGYQYFDTTLNKPIWRSNSNTWIDAAGETV